MHRPLRGFSVALAALVLTTQVQAGSGFWLMLGNPEASTEARALNAAVTVRVTGCPGPAKDARITGHAVGIVDGKRQTIPLKLMALREPGMFAVAKQWPDQGQWIVQLVGRSDSAVTTSLAVIGPDGIDRSSKRDVPGEASEAQLSELLNQARVMARN